MTQAIDNTQKDLDTLRQELEKEGSEFPIYMDYQSTTPVDKRVVEAMMPYLTEKFGNPHSRSHSYGWDAEEGVETARSHIAELLGGKSKEVIFTSGATESNSLAIKGVARFYGDKKNHIITTNTEHKCVLDACRHLEEEEGFKVTYLPVKENGLIEPAELEEAITDNTLMVSVMAVNNEIGVIQPLKEIGKICRRNGVFFHSDIAQGYGKIDIDVNENNIDLASISGHKIYAPKGIGALYIRRKPRVRLAPLINGGGQERGVRSGTVSPPMAVALGEASRIAKNQMNEDYEHVKKLYDKFLTNILDGMPEIYLNGDRYQRYPGNINLSFAYIEGESMILAIKDIAVSSGSACTSASLEPSYVLKALGVDEDLAHTSIRFGIGRFTTEKEIDYAVKLVLSKINHLRELSPLWEMVQEGIDIKSIQWAAH
jgi:cysteine desulfurase